MRFLKSSFSLLAAATLSACAAGQAFQTPERSPVDRAPVYPYRTFALYDGSNSHRVSINGQGERPRLPNMTRMQNLLHIGSSVTGRDEKQALGELGRTQGDAVETGRA